MSDLMTAIAEVAIVVVWFVGVWALAQVCGRSAPNRTTVFRVRDDK